MSLATDDSLIPAPPAASPTVCASGCVPCVPQSSAIAEPVLAVLPTYLAGRAPVPCACQATDRRWATSGLSHRHQEVPVWEHRTSATTHRVGSQARLAGGWLPPLAFCFLGDDRRCLRRGRAARAADVRCFRFEPDSAVGHDRRPLRCRHRRVSLSA